MKAHIVKLSPLSGFGFDPCFLQTLQNSNLWEFPQRGVAVHEGVKICNIQPKLQSIS